jgi:mono/diheme cytochrome c family protein
MMNRATSKRRLLSAVTLAMFGLGYWSHALRASAGQASLPEGPGSEVARSSCLVCHGAEPIVQQHLSRAKWQAEVEKMERWGAELPADKKAPLLDYLTARFGSHLTVSPRKPAELPDDSGVEIARESCLSCHGPEPITQQRLTTAQWSAEVEKMMRWGATVPADRKQALVEYLSRNFPSKN